MAGIKLARCATPGCSVGIPTDGPPACATCWYGSAAMHAAHLTVTRDAPGVPAPMRAAWWKGAKGTTDRITKHLTHVGGLA